MVRNPTKNYSRLFILEKFKSFKMISSTLFNKNETKESQEFVKCFICQGPHYVADYPRKLNLGTKIYALFEQ